MLRSRARRIFAIITVRSLIELGLTGGAVFAFILLAREVIDRDTDAFDERLARWIRAALDSPAADGFFTVFTNAGSGPFLIVVTVVAAFLMFRRGFRWTALVMIVNGLVAETLMTLLKHLVARDRPHLDPLIPLPASYSFPSGHALASFAVYTTVIYAFARTSSPRVRIACALLGALLIVTIGLSRVYLGVHWPLDVVAGYLAGAPLFAVSVHLMRRLDPIRA